MDGRQLYQNLQPIHAYPYVAKEKWTAIVTRDCLERQGWIPKSIAALLGEVLAGLPSFKYIEGLLKLGAPRDEYATEAINLAAALAKIPQKSNIQRKNSCCGCFGVGWIFHSFRVRS